MGRIAASRTGFLRAVVALILTVSLLFLNPAPALSQWLLSPEIRIAGGEESDLVIDPGLTRTVVAAGPFVELTPVLAARGWIGHSGFLSLRSHTTLQRFLNDNSRLLLLQTLSGDILKYSGGFRGRFSAVFNYFDDSERNTVRRFGAGAELGAAWMHARWNAELWGGIHRRQYPNITITTAQNQPIDYSELALSTGAILSVSPAERVNIQTNGSFRQTDSRDPFFDAMSYTVSGNADIKLVSRLHFSVSSIYQDRTFANRPVGEDRDTYWQIGTELRYTVFNAWTTAVRGGYSDYTWTDGNREDSYRITMEIRYTWGRDMLPPPIHVDMETLSHAASGSVQQPDEQGNVRFRVQAPGAGNVAIAGDFNSWNPSGARLRPAGDGWWEIRLELAPGHYEYVYVIDGKWITPPEAKITVNDGFGGRNGIVEVLPSDL